MAGRWQLLTAVGVGASSAAAWLLQHEPALAEPQQPQEDQLRLVQVVFRHGARSPLGKRYWPELVDAWDVCGKEYDGVPLQITTIDGGERPVNDHDHQQINTVLKGGCSKGELTRIGQRQALNFGAWLRRRYVQELGFLPSTYENGALLARSTNYSRTIATLRGVLTGLYSSTSGNSVPVHVTEELDEILFANVQSCKRLGELLKELQAKDKQKSQAVVEEVKQLNEVVGSALGLKDDDPPINYLELHDAVTTMSTHGKPLPKILDDPKVKKDIEIQATNRFLSFIAPHAETGRQKEVLRLGMGRLMEELIQKMQQAATDTKGTHKMYFYSGHDSTIMPLLAALIGHVDHWPTYLSNLIFELWEKPSGEHYVKVLYNTKELPLPCRFCKSSNERVDLDAFRQHILGPYLLSKDVQEKECAVLHFSHDLPAGQHVKKVKVGSSMEEEEVDTTP